jgi:wyosine [tRNA(Phe)-imidazoG37] synthetase (radical SAM superfamily)
MYRRVFMSISVDNPVRGIETPTTIAFGPVPSRRLGRSLGINNIPHKICTYSCVYCQVGRTLDFRLEPSELYEPEAVARVVAEKITKARELNAAVDYLTFVPDGEPTLDLHIGRTIELLKPLGVKIAVITNGTLLKREDVRTALRCADWVSFKIDSAIEWTWRRINRPHASMQLNDILEGMLEFRKEYLGTLATETMLVRGLNDGDANLNSIAAFLSRLKPEVAYISIPTRPPAQSWVLQPKEETVARAHQILAREIPKVEYLIGYEGNAFAFTGKPDEDLLSITAVHPMREDAVSELLRKVQADWSVVWTLIERGEIVETDYEGWKFFIRSFPKKKNP